MLRVSNFFDMILTLTLTFYKGACCANLFLQTLEARHHLTICTDADHDA
jgi:hypothetical protein